MVNKVDVEIIEPKNQFYPVSSPRRKVKALIALIIILMVPALVLMFLHSKVDFAPLPLNKELPFVRLTTINGGAATLDKFRSSRIIIMVFSAECPHCLRMLSVFEAMNRKYGNALKFIALSISNPDTTEKLVSEMPYSFQVFVDKNNELKRVLRISALPTILFVDTGLVLRSEQYGEASENIEEKSVKSFIANRVLSRY
jgi:thiol-disulfide isomerase/thioredoxin